MEMERRGSVRRVLLNIQLDIEDEVLDKTKPFDIPKALVWKAFKLVKLKSNGSRLKSYNLSKMK